MEIEVRHEPERSRFVARVEGVDSVLAYARVSSDTVDFRSTYVPPSVRGRKIGDALVCHALDWARGEGLTVIPTCWFVGTIVRRHPEYAPLLA